MTEDIDLSVPAPGVSPSEWQHMSADARRTYWNLAPELRSAAVPDIKATILGEAGKIVNGARRGAYGTPENNFERIARFWNAYLVNVGILPPDVLGDPEAKNGITAADVSPMMRLMKEARLCETPDHYDSFVDIVGYTLTGAEVNGVKSA